MSLPNLLIFLGLIIIILGVLIKFLSNKIPLLPGDILIRKNNFTFYFPITTSLLVSIIVSLILIIIKIFKR